MKIILRKRKLPSGKINLSIEYYKGTIVQENGKRKTIREWENLKLFLHSKPLTKEQTKENEKNLALANEILVNRINENAKNRVLATLSMEGKFLSTGVIDLSFEVKKIEDAKLLNEDIRNKIEMLKTEIDNLYLELDRNNSVIQQSSYNVLQRLIKEVSSSKTKKVFDEYAAILLNK